MKRRIAFPARFNVFDNEQKCARKFKSESRKEGGEANVANPKPALQERRLEKVLKNLNISFQGTCNTPAVIARAPKSAWPVPGQSSSLARRLLASKD